MKEKKCKQCGGQGWYADHDTMSNHSPEDGSCISCPIQVQCEYCQGTGILQANKE